MDENKKFETEQKLPDDFRPVIPEPEVRRKSIVQFSKNYPVEDSPTSTHTMSFTQEEARKKAKRAVIYALVLLAAFSMSFIITDTCIRISKEPIQSTSPASDSGAALPPTQAAPSVNNSTEAQITEIAGSSFYIYSE